MRSPSGPSSTFRFGAFEFDATAGELRKRGVPIKVHPQPLRVLQLLIDRHGQVVTREEIQRALWSDDTFVDFDRGINFCINQIRAALLDDAEHPRYIETLPRRGYRFIARLDPKGNGGASQPQTAMNTTPGDLSQCEQDADSARQASGGPVAETSALRVTSSSRRNVLYGFAALLGLLAITLGWVRFNSSRSGTRAVLNERQLTHNVPENRALGGAISPDGKHLLFADTKGLHLITIDGSELHDIPLPEDLQAQLWFVAWFPDGEKVLLTTYSETDGFVIWATSVFGGIPRKVHTHGRRPVVSPQGSSIAFTNDNGREVWVMGVDGENAKKILTSEDERFTALAWSPTSERLAYIKSQPAGNGVGGSIETVALQSGVTTVVLSEPRLFSDGGAASLLWLQDRRLIFALQEGAADSEANLWKIIVDPQTGEPLGNPKKVTNWYGASPWSSSVSYDGTRLALTKARLRDDVYVAGLKEDGTRLEPPKRLTFSDSLSFPDAWTRDSNAVLLESDRAGRFQIFTQQLEQDTAQLLIQGPDDVRNAEFTPDGASVLYWATPHGAGPPTSMRLMRAPRTGRGPPEQVLEIPFNVSAGFDCPSHAGSWCIVGIPHQDHVVFYALDPLRGAGKEVARNQRPTGSWSVSPDGTRLAITIAHAIRIFDMRSRKGRNLKFLGQISSLSWAADGKALFVAVQSPGYSLVRIDLDGKTSVLLNRGRNKWLSDPWSSPDGHYIAFSQQSWDSNIWLIENF